MRKRIGHYTVMYLGKLSFKNENELETLLDEQKLRMFNSYRFLLKKASDIGEVTWRWKSELHGGKISIEIDEHGININSFLVKQNRHTSERLQI